jgi:hypothetical protein
MRVAVLITIGVSWVSTLSAGIIFTREAPGVQQTSVANAIQESFDSLPLGALGVYVSPIGTYSNGATIVAPNVFGGAFQTQYNAVGVQSDTTQYEVSFSGLRTYFGFYWSAADIQNNVDFYEGASLKGTFGIGDILAGLPAAYFGNPNTGENPEEAYIYLNFTSSDLASRFDRVVFRNSTSGSGFETDNHAIFDELIDPPGVPEPSSFLLMSAGVGAVLAMAARRKRS